MQTIIQMANTSPQEYRKQKLHNGYENQSSSDLKRGTKIEDIQRQE